LPTNITPGTFTKLTVNNNGLITFGMDLLASDIPTITSFKLNDFENRTENIIKNNKITSMKLITSSFDVNGNNIINLSTPYNNNDAATKKYVDDSLNELLPTNIVNGIYTKVSVNNNGLIVSGS
jgi:hypothetical protein